MAIIRPRLNDYYNLPFTQEEVDFAIPFIDEDIPLYLDPFLLWKSPSLQDQSLHLAIVNSFNHLGYLMAHGKEQEALTTIIQASECNEVGLGMSKTKKGLKIGEKVGANILSLFVNIPQIRTTGFFHLEEIQLLVDQVSKDRIGDIASNLIKSFLIDFTIDQAAKFNIPRKRVTMDVYDNKSNSFKQEILDVPVNEQTGFPVLLVPKRWLRFSPWINYEDYFDSYFIKEISCAEDVPTSDRIAVLNYNRDNYGVVRAYIEQKERTQEDCKNDPLFKPIPVISAKGKLRTILSLPTGKTDNADKKFENAVCQLMASLLYPHLDFAVEQSRTDSGVQIRDLVFYNNRSYDFLKDIYDDYQCRQIVIELKNVDKIEREHINQLNRYLTDQFGRFGVIVTRHPLPRNIFQNTIDLWSGQRKCIIVLTDEDLRLMVDVFESKQRLPIEVIKRRFIEFTRACPS